MSIPLWTKYSVTSVMFLWNGFQIPHHSGHLYLKRFYLLKMCCINRSDVLFSAQSREILRVVIPSPPSVIYLHAVNTHGVPDMTSAKQNKTTTLNIDV